MKRFLLTILVSMVTALGFAQSGTYYTCVVKGTVTATGATFTWTPSAKDGSDALARQKAAAEASSNPTVDAAKSVAYSEGCYLDNLERVSDASEFTLTGVTGNLADPKVTIEKASDYDADSKKHYNVVFAYPLFDLTKKYMLKEATTELYFKLDETSGMDGSTNEKNAATFSAAGVSAFTIDYDGDADTYTFTSQGGATVNAATGKNYNFSNTATGASKTSWTLTSVEGGYQIGGVSEGTYVGADTKTAGSYLYTNKSSADTWVLEPVYAVTGNVKDGDAAVEGATVTLTSSTGSYQATSASDGSYTAYAPNGTYTISATKGVRIAGTTATATVSSAAATASNDVTLGAYRYTMSISGCDNGAVVINSTDYANGATYDSTDGTVTFAAKAVSGYVARAWKKGYTIYVNYNTAFKAQETYDPATATYYFLKINKSNKYVISEDNMNGDNLAGNSTTAASSDKGLWAIVGTEGNYSFVNKSTGKYITSASATDKAAQLPGEATATYHTYAITPALQQGYWMVNIPETNCYWNHGANLNTWNSDNALWGWGYSESNPDTGDPGAFVMIEEAVDVTYNISISGCANGRVVIDETEYESESTYSTPFALPTYTAKAIDGYSSRIWKTSDNTIHVVYNKNLTTSETAAAATKYYYIKVKNGGYLASDRLSDTYLSSSNTTTPTGTDAELWAVVGTSPNYAFYNKGSQTYITAAATTSDSKFTLESDGTADLAQFNIAPAVKKGYWVINTKDATNGYWNNQTTLTVWNSSYGLWGWGCTEANAKGDNGSMIEFIDPDELADETAEYNTINGIAARPSDLSDMTLWYNTMATSSITGNTWQEWALPIGNGGLGATIMGKVLRDEIQFNEKSLFRGKATDQGAGGSADGYGAFVNFGSVIVKDMGATFSTADATVPVQDYVRYLDIDKAVAGVRYANTATGHATTYTRQYIADIDKKAVIAHYTATGDDKLQLKITLEPESQLITLSDVTYASAGATFHGKLETVSFNAGIKVLSDGTVTTNAENITVTDGTYVDVILSGMTDYDAASATRVSNTSGIASTIQSRLTAAAEALAGNKFEDVKAANTTTYQAYFNKSKIDLKGTVSDKTTNALIDAYQTSYYGDSNSSVTERSAEALFLENLYYNYGKYLLIACNTDQTIHAPAGLVGLWMNKYDSGSWWNGDIHSNINVQMCYWPAEASGLGDMHLPFLNHIIDLYNNTNGWNQWAVRYYGGAVEGWTVPVECNIFGGGSTFCDGDYKCAGAWYCNHLWQHYLYTQDTEYLKKAFPAMLSAAKYIKASMTLASDGTYELNNEYSPEHGSDNQQTAHAQQICRELFANLLDAASILGTTYMDGTTYSEYTTFYNAMDDGLATETETEGTLLKEWKYKDQSTVGDYTSHRHLSHLMCLYPFSQVNAYQTSDDDKALYDAAKLSLKVRGNEATGWSMGWKINLWARAQDAAYTHQLVTNALHHAAGISYGGGIYYNMWDAHAPFQMDGNEGYTAGVNELLLQSYDGIALVPALPSSWPAGSYTGLKAVGNFSVDCEWAEGAVTSATITSGSGSKLRLQTTTAAPMNKAIVKVDGTVKLCPEQTDGSYLVSDVAANSVVTLTFDGKSYTVALNGVPTGASATYAGTALTDKMSFVASATLSASDISCTEVDGYKAFVNVDNTAGTITVTYGTPVEVSFTNTSNLGYVTTYSASNNMTIQDTDVKAYVIKTAGSGNVVLTPITGNIIDAEAGVVLINTAGAEKATIYQVTEEPTAAAIAEQAHATDGTANYLVGCPTQTTVAADVADTKYNYVMTSVNGIAVLRAMDATDRTIAAGKAYVELGSASQARDTYGIVIGDATGISSIENGKLKVENANIYDLTGRKQNGLQKGVNIVNGKKVIR